MPATAASGPGPALVRGGAERHRVRPVRDELPQSQPVLQRDRRQRPGHLRPGHRALHRLLLHRLSRGHPPLRPELPDQHRQHLGGRRAELPAEHAAKSTAPTCRSPRSTRPPCSATRSTTAASPPRARRGDQRLRAQAGDPGTGDRHPVLRPGTGGRPPDRGRRSRLQPPQRGRRRRPALRPRRHLRHRRTAEQRLVHRRAQRGQPAGTATASTPATRGATACVGSSNIPTCSPGST